VKASTSRQRVARRGHQTSVAILPNVLAKDLAVVFCGTAAGRRSAEVRAYYAGRGNKFWATLHETGLTPRRFEPAEYRRVLSHQLGLTDLAKRTSGADSTLKRSDFSRPALRRVIAKYRPKVVAFTSKRAAMEFFGGRVDYGLYPEVIDGTRFFVLSSPSGLASGSWQKGRHWHELAALVRALPPARKIPS
jgi:TDG/mug DNA glycosylase family protein